MFTSAPSSIKFSLDHAFDIKLRCFIADLWANLALGDRESWINHPDIEILGIELCFWKENYFRWRQNMGPLHSWPSPNWQQPPMIEDMNCEASGTSVRGSLTLSNVEGPGTLALAFYSKHRGTIFGRGLQELIIFNGKEKIIFNYSSIRPGWQKGLAVIFSNTGDLYFLSYLPSVFCS